MLLKDWGDNGPTLLWESKKGEGYASPAISKGILILFYREEGMETIEGLNAENGHRKWVYKYPVKYKDRYGYSNGPRASPVIEGNYVFCHGVTSWLTCLDLNTGKLIWNREMIGGSYVPKVVNLRTLNGERRENVSAIAFIMNHDHENYTGKLDLKTMAKVIASAEGPLGKCRDYLFNTVTHLDDLGLSDKKLSILAKLVRSLVN